MISPDRRHELGAIYERYASMVHRRCRSILGSEDEAWDATQEVFVKLANSLPHIKKAASMHSWLLSTSTHHCISLLRKRRTVEFDETQHGHDEERVGIEQRLILKQLVSGLLLPWDKKTRELVIYAYVDGYRQEEIARLTGMGESTVRKYLTRFKRRAAESAEAVKEVWHG